jgi:hypothetical protein
MRNRLIYLLAVLFFSTAAFAQQAKTNFQTHSARLKVLAYLNDKEFEWENDNIIVSLNYKTGQLLVRLKNTDFIDTDHPENFVVDSTTQSLEYELKGTLPINEIIQQQTTQQEYKVELQLVNEVIGFYKTILFNMTITLPNTTGNGDYRIFILTGEFDNREFQLPAFRKFDPQIYVILSFTGLVMGG